MIRRMRDSSSTIRIRPALNRVPPVGQRQRQPKRGLSRMTTYGQVAVVCLGYPMRDAQAEARARNALPYGRAAVKALEYAALLLERYAFAAVGHVDFGRAVAVADVNLNRTF